MKSMPVRLLLRLSAAAILAAAVSSCDSFLGPEGLAPTEAASALAPGESSIELLPPGPYTLLPGDTLRVRARLRSGSGGFFLFEISDTSVAAVGPDGLVTALRPGSASLTVMLRNDRQTRTSVPLVVRSRGPSTVSIERITRTDSSDVDVSALSGRVLAHVRFQRGDAVALEVTIDTSRACIAVLERTGTGVAVAESEQAVCSVDTAAYDSIAAAARFRNGPAALTARLLGADRKPLASSDAVPVTLVNRDTLIVRVDGRAQANDATGRTWIGGDVTVSAAPILYSGASAASVNFTYQAPEGRVISLEDRTAPFRAVIRDTSLAGTVDDRFVVTAVATGGGVTLQASSPSVGYDGVPPQAGTLESRAWLGADLLFAALYTAPTQPDVGVGRSAPVFFAGGSSLSASSIFSAGLRVAGANELRESGPGAYRLVYRVCDAVLNCVAREGFDFGVDLTPPRVRSINLPPRPVNPKTDLEILLDDERSGLPDTPLLVSVQYISPDGHQPVCGPVVNGLRFPGQTGGAGCEAERRSGIIPVPRSNQGYYIYRIAIRDRAENRRDFTDRVVLIDDSAPRITSFTPPTQYTPGEEVLLQAQVTDNVDLASADFRLVFGPGAAGLPFSGALDIGRPFTGQVTRTFAASARMPFVRTLTTIDGQARTTTLVSGIRARVVDAAGFATSMSEALSPNSFGGNTSTADPFPALSSITASSPASEVCTQRCRATDLSTVPVTVQIVGDAGVGSFSRLFLFARDAGGHVISLGSTRNFSVVETGTQRTYTYQLNPPPPTGLEGEYFVFGVAVNSAGSALRSGEIPITFVAR